MKTFTPEELEARRLRIGSSEASSVMGLNKYCGPIALWLDKTGKVPIVVEESPQTVRGKLFEPWLLDRYEERILNTDEKLWRNSEDKFFVHPDYDFVTATPDGYVVAPDNEILRLVEIKTAGHRVAWKWGSQRSDLIPPDYMVQVQWQMEVMDVDHCDVYALVDEEERLYCVERNHEFGKILMQQAKEFWAYVQAEEIPPADFSDEFVMAMSLRYPERTPPIEATGELLELCEALAASKVTLDNAKERYALHRNKVLEAMEDAKTAYGEFGRVTLATVKGRKPYVIFKAKKEITV